MMESEFRQFGVDSSFKPYFAGILSAPCGTLSKA